VRNKSNAIPAFGILVERIIATSINARSYEYNFVCDPAVTPIDAITVLPVFKPNEVNVRSEELENHAVISHAVNPIWDAGEKSLCPEFDSEMVTATP